MMRKTKIALAALMMGTMALTGVSYAEASTLNLKDILISLRLKEDDKTPPRPEMREAPKPPERDPAPQRVDDRGPHRDKQPGPEHKPQGPQQPKPPAPRGPHFEDGRR